MKKVEKSDTFIAAKKSANEKRRERANQIANQFKGGAEPETNILDYKISLIKATNWYNINADLKILRGYLNDYLMFTDRKKTITKLNQVSDYDIRTLGVLCRLKMRDQYLEDQHEKIIEDSILKLSNSINAVKRQIAEDVPRVKVDNSDSIAKQYCEAFEEAIDKFVKTHSTGFSASDYLKANNITSTISKKIGEYYATMLAELKESLVDPDLAEGYSNFTKTQMKKFIAFVESIVNACLQRRVSVKVKPKKAVPASKIVEKVQYAKDNSELKLKSISPIKLVDSSEIWTYNVKYKTITQYKSDKGIKMSVKGTTIIGFDIKSSTQLRIRKPDEFFLDNNLNKGTLVARLKTLKTKSTVPNGRLNNETIILGVW